jgi:subfamily B ATP-binding cassette protein MsbA
MRGRQVWHRLYAYLRPYMWPYFAAALACMAVYSATSGAVPWLVRALVDGLTGTREATAMAGTIVAVVGVFIVRGLTDFGQSYLGEHVGQHVVFELRRALSEKIQSLPASFFDRVSSATVISRVTSDVLLVRQALTEGAAAMIRDATTVTVLVAVAFWLDVSLAVIAFLVFPAVVLPLQSLSRKMRRLSYRGLDSLGNLSALLQETLIGNRVVKAFGMQGYERERFETESRRLLGIYMRAARIKAFTTPMTEVTAAFGVAAVLWYGGASVVGGGRTVGDFLAFLSALVLLYEPFKKLVRTNNIVQTGLGAADRIFALLDEPAEERREGGVHIGGLAESIHFENVGFAYRDEAVLEGVSFEVRAGEIFALVGPSGGGKSTIADLIPRFYEVRTGRIALDGRDLRDIDLDSLRAQIGVVTQFTFLFNDTVRANIAYGRARTTDEQVTAAAAAANAHDFIVELPHGYETVVGELGVQLSGGQRQRVAIARALLKNAPILILDEATSALDARSERLVQAAVERLMEGRTTIVIAHRLSTVKRADRIAVVADGRIVEIGTHDELMARAGTYRALFGLQLEDADDAILEHAAPSEAIAVAEVAGG